MALDPSIILAGRSPDMINALAGGVQAGQQMRAAQTQNALSDLYRTQGAGIMAGQQPALNALAQISPEAALGIQGARQQMDARSLDMSATRQGMAHADKRMQFLTAEERRAAESHAAKLSAAERQAQAAKVEDAVKMGLMIQTPQEWDQVMATQAPDLVGQFGNRQAIASRYMSIADILKQSEPRDPTKGAPTGYMFTDPSNPAAGVKPIPGYQDKRMEFLTAEERRAAESHAAKLSAAERQAQAAKVEDAVKMGLMIQTPQEWDQVMATQAPDLVGQFGNRQALAARYMSIADILKQNAPPVPLSAPGKIQADINAGILPAGTPLRGPGTTINNNMGSGKFDEVFASEDAKALAGVSSAAIDAQSNLGRIERLSGIMANSPSGAEAAFKSMLGDYGIATEGLDNLQAAEALINAMVPGQRPPGSGTMSDRDVELFKKSLPRLINTPEGNAKILSTLRGISEYDIQRGGIVQALRAGQIDRSQAFSALQSLPNPLSGFSAPATSQQQPAQPAKTGAPAQIGSQSAGAVEDGYRFKGGDPADPANWEQVQ